MSLKKSNIFISDISSIILYNLLDNIHIINQTDSNYRIDPEIFRQLQYNNHRLNILILMENPYGNYVIQRLIEKS